MFTHLKICGITTLQDAMAAAQIGVTFLGFNFYAKSKRYISPEDAAQIIKALPPVVQTVGILVKPRLQDCLRAVEVSGVHFLQIYQPQDFEDFSVLPVPVIAAFRLQQGQKFNYRARGEHYVLVDAFTPTAFGGTGQTLDWWGIPKDIPRERLVLAGGITPENVLEALNTVNPAVIDVASGAEVFPGKKDAEKMKALQKAILTFNILKMNQLEHWLLR